MERKLFSYTRQYIHFCHPGLYFSIVIIETENSTPEQTPAESLFTNISDISDGGETRHTKKNNIIHFIADIVCFLAGFSGALMLIRAAYIFFL